MAMTSDFSVGGFGEGSTVTNLWSGSSKSPITSGQSMWEGLASMGKTQWFVDNVLNPLALKYTGLDTTQLTEGFNTILVDRVANAVGVGFDWNNTEAAQNAINSFEKSGVHKQVITGSQEAKIYNADKKAFLSSFDAQYGGKGYDKDYWTEAKLSEEFNKRYSAQGGTDAQATIVDDVLAVVSNDYADKQDKGWFDTKGNKTDQYGQEEPVDTGSADMLNLLKDSGWDTSTARASDFADYLAKQKKEYGLTDYELRGMVDADKDTIELEANKARAELLPQLEDLDKEELALIDEENVRLGKEATKFFTEDVAPTVRKETLLLGGRGASFGEQSLAKAAKELEETRETYIGNLRTQANQASIERKRTLASDQYSQALNISAYGGQSGLQTYKDAINTQIQSIDALNQVNLAKEASLTNRAAERYNRELQKSIARETKRAEEAAKAAAKKSSKIGLFANTFSGILQGAMAGAAGGPGGAVAGAIAGGTSAYASSKAAMGGANIQSLDYSKIGSGAANIYNKWNLRQNTGRTQNENQFSYLRYSNY